MSDYNKNILDKISKNLENCLNILEQEGGKKGKSTRLSRKRRNDERSQRNDPTVIRAREAREAFIDERRASNEPGLPKTGDVLTNELNKRDTSAPVLKKISDLISKLGDVSSEVNNPDGDYHYTKKEVAARFNGDVSRTEPSDVEEMNNQVKREIETKTTDLNSKNAEILALGQKAKQLAAINKELEETSKQITSQLSSDLARKDSELDSLEEMLEGEMKLDDLTESLEQLNSQFGGGTTDASFLINDEEVKALRGKVENFLAKKSSIATKLRRLQTRLPELLNKYNKFIALSPVLRELKTSETTLSELNNSLSKVSETIARDEAEIDKLEARKKLLEEAVESEQGSRLQKNQELQRRKESINRMIDLANLDSVESNVNMLESSISEIETAMSGPATPTMTPRDETEVTVEEPASEVKRAADGEVKRAADDEVESDGEVELDDEVKRAADGDERFKYQFKFVNI